MRCCGVTGARIVVLVAMSLVFVGQVAASTQAGRTAEPAASQAAGQPQDEFVPVKALPQQEQLPAAPLLMTAYAFVWAVLLVYLWTIWRRLMKVEGEMHALSTRIADRVGRQ
ncbi:MAG TPA: CcmD family protein [Vicinamibacterales bacterium]|jgi:CcmD family protein